MEDAEKTDLLNSESSDTMTIALHPSRPSSLELEKVKTDRSLSHQPTPSTNAFRTQSQALSRTRSLVTDGFSVYNAEGDQEEFEDSEDPEAPRRVSTNAWEVRWEKDDPTYPRNFSLWRKWLIVFIASFSSFCVACTSSIYSQTYDQLEKRFNSSREVVTLGLSTNVLGLAFGPMLLGPLSEFYGRRPIYLGSIAMFAIWLIPEAVAQNLAKVIVGMDTIRFAVADAILEVTKEGLVIRCSKCPHNVSCYCCCGL